MNEAALLIVDLQNDFCPGGALPVPDGDKIVPIINDLISIAVGRNMPILASKCWHPSDTTHFNTHGGPWPPHCIKTTKGAELHPDLKIPKNPILIYKCTKPNEDAYSAFDGKDRTGKTLLEILQNTKTEILWICGFATDYCVKATALDAKKYGFNIWVFKNACAAVNINPSDGKKSIEEMEQVGIKVLSLGIW